MESYPDDYAAFIGIGQTVNVLENEQYGYDWAYQKATDRGDQEALDLLGSVGCPESDGGYPGAVPEAYADAIDTLIFESGVYDEDSWIDAWQCSQSIFDDPDVWTFEFKDPNQGFLDYNVPVYFFMGQHDYDTPVNLFEEYYALIVSDKAYIRFESSAHFPFYEEAAMFREELLRVKTDTFCRLD